MKKTLKQILRENLLKEHKVYSNSWKKDFGTYGKRIKGLIHGINKSFESMSEVSFDQELRDNYIEDLRSVGDMVKRAIDKLGSKK